MKTTTKQIVSGDTAVLEFETIGVVGPPASEMLEAYTTLGFLAAHTERVPAGRSECFVRDVPTRNTPVAANTRTEWGVLDERAVPNSGNASRSITRLVGFAP